MLKMPTTMISEGKAVPQFSATNQHGNEVNNKSMLGQKYILFFYGQDDTPTCTKQVCAANDIHAKADKLGYKIIGVSPDSVKKHQKFTDKYHLQIDLLSDPEKKMMYDFESYGPKIFMGKEVIGVYRKAYFIDEKGLISHIISEVKAATQGDQILEIIG